MKFVPNILEEIIFDICKKCTQKMSVGAGAFAAQKIRKNMEKMENFPVEIETASNYSSKYMNSIWGMYNRLAVHNLKKMMDFPQTKVTVQQDGVGPSNNGRFMNASKIRLTMEMI